jgi:hypothetical protein
VDVEVVANENGEVVVDASDVALEEDVGTPNENGVVVEDCECWEAIDKVIPN